MVAYQVEGLVMDGTFDTTDGTCAIKAEAAEDLKVTFNKGFIKEDLQPLAPLILFPQKPQSGKVMLRVFSQEIDGADDQKYVCALPIDAMGLEPGKSYNYTIQITKIGLNILTSTIENWDNDNNFNIFASIDGETTKEKVTGSNDQQ